MTTPSTDNAATAREALDAVMEAGRALTAEKISAVATMKRNRCRTDMRPAAVAACATCPWLREQADSDDDLLEGAALVAYWEEVREGAVFGCHKTILPADRLSPEQIERGWRPTPEDQTPRECAGALAQVLKEESLRDELGSHEAYFNLRGPYGVSAEGFERLARRREGLSSPAVRAVHDLDRYGRPWFPDPDGENSLPVTPPCFCPVCARHEEAHEQTTLIAADGQEVGIDRGIADLVRWLWGRGVVTVGSCQSMVEAIERLWPEKRDIILAEDSRAPEDMNYRKIVTSDLAFIRGLRHPALDDLAAVVEAVCEDHEVAQWGPAMHVAFPLADAGQLLERLLSP